MAAARQNIVREEMDDVKMISVHPRGTINGVGNSDDDDASKVCILLRDTNINGSEKGARILKSL